MVVVSCQTQAHSCYEPGSGHWPQHQQEIELPYVACYKINSPKSWSHSFLPTGTKFQSSTLCGESSLFFQELFGVQVCWAEPIRPKRSICFWYNQDAWCKHPLFENGVQILFENVEIYFSSFGQSKYIILAPFCPVTFNTGKEIPLDLETSN